MSIQPPRSTAKRLPVILSLALATLALPLAASHQFASSTHLLWLKPDGTVWASGQHNSGARGDTQHQETRKAFKPIAGLKDVVQIALHDNQSSALKKDGTVWVWGMFNYMEPYDKPKQIPGFADIQAIAMGDDFVVGLKRDGSVWIMADGEYGLDGGNKAAAQRAVSVAGLTDVVAVGATESTAFAVKKDGTVWGWGSAYGKLLEPAGKWDSILEESGDNPKPLKIEGVSGITALSGGQQHVLALTRDGKVYAWGDNEDGALGVQKRGGLVGTYQRAGVVDGLPKITAISAGYDFSLALDGEGKVWAWGSNTYGTLGVSDKVVEESRIVPQRVPGIETAVAIHGGHYHAFAVLADGRVLGWGSNDPDFIPLLPGKPAFLPPTPMP